MKNVENFIIRHKYFLILLLITVFGSLIRLWHLDKNGLWYDESCCYWQASASFPFGILELLTRYDIHAPLYYFMLHFWFNIFGTSEITARVLSLIWGILIIPVTYLTGKELKNSKIGLYAAFFAAINSFFIYYSQEVKFYSFVAFLGALMVYFLIKTASCVQSNRVNKYLFGLSLTNIAAIYVFVFNAFFVCIQIIIFSIYLYKYNRKILEKFYVFQLFALLLVIPLIPMTLEQFGISRLVIPDSYSSLTLENIGRFPGIMFAPLLTLHNIFSPSLYSLIFPYLYYLDLFDRADAIYSYIILVLIPLIFNIYGIIRAVRDGCRLNLYLFSISFIFFLTLITLAFMGIFPPTSRYFMIMAPVLILLSVYGLLEIKNKPARIILVSYLAAVNILFLVFSPSSAPKIQREEDIIPYANILKSLNLTKGDIIVMPFHGRFYLNRAYDVSGKRGTVANWGYSDIKKLDSPIFYDGQFIRSINKNNYKELVYEYLTSKTPSLALQNNLHKEVIDKVDVNHRLVVMIQNYIPFNSGDIDFLVNNKPVFDKLAKSKKLIILQEPKITYDILKTLSSHLELQDNKDIELSSASFGKINLKVVVFKKVIPAKIQSIDKSMKLINPYCAQTGCLSLYMY